MKSPFLTLVAHRFPGLVVTTDWSARPRATVVAVRHRLHPPPSLQARAAVRQLLRGAPLAEMRAFYTKNDGVDLCVEPDDTRHPHRPLVELLPILEWERHTAAYVGEGEWAWTIELNSYRKVRTFYRGKHAWVVFATLGEGPGCLTVFLDGPDAGKVFYLAPEPRWNIAVPVARSFGALLDRVAADLAAFLRHVGVTVSRVSPRGESWGLWPRDYLKSGSATPRTKSPPAPSAVRKRPRKKGDARGT